MNIKFFFIKIYFVFLFIILELKKNINHYLTTARNLWEIKFLSLCNFILFDKRPKFKNNDINLFLEKNYKINKYNNSNNKKKILIELLLPHHFEPMILNCLIGKNLSKLFNYECEVLINKNDYLLKEIVKSFNIKKYNYLEDNKLFTNIIYFIKSLYLIRYDLIDNNLYKLKYEGNEIGKAALEHYLRFHNQNPKKKNKFLQYTSLAKAIVTYKSSKKIFANKYKYFIIGETQFIPNKILFHSALKSRTPVYTWKGWAVKGYIGRIINNYKNRNSIILQFSKKMTDKLIKIFKRKNILSILYKKNEINNIGIETIWSETKIKKNISFKTKVDFYDYFRLKYNKNILILPHAMSDNLFNNKWNIFHNSYEWFYETVKQLTKINNVNWLIKPHPYEYKFQGITARKIFNELKINKKNIIFLEEDFHVRNLHKYIDTVITGNGSAGYEYTSLGIPVITTSDAAYSNFSFTVSPKNNLEYFKLLRNIYKLKKPSNLQIKKAQIFWYNLNYVLKNSHQILPKINQHGFFKKNLFFNKIRKQNLNLFKQNSLFDDIKFQTSSKNRHTININFIKKQNLKENFRFNDIN